MKADRWLRCLILGGSALGLSGCVTRTWDDQYEVTEAVAPVGSHYRRTYKYGEEPMPAVSPRVKIEGEGLKMLVDQMRVAGGR